MDEKEWNIPLMSEEADPSPAEAEPVPNEVPSKREEGIWSAVLMQMILAIIVAIGFLGCRLIAPEIAEQTVAIVQETAEQDFSFRDKLMVWFDHAVTTLNGSVLPSDEPDSTTSLPPSQSADGQALHSDELSLPLNGQGGRFLPSDGWVVPDDATFAPVVFTGALSFPLESGWRQTSAFGFRESPIYDNREFHAAVDIAAAQGSNILAVFNGTVMESRYDRYLGNYIRIDHGNGFISTYGHCDRLIAREGTRIRSGEVIAKVGSTGDSTGFHLHLALEHNGISFDPAWVYPDQLWSLRNDPTA